MCTRSYDDFKITFRHYYIQEDTDKRIQKSRTDFNWFVYNKGYKLTSVIPFQLSCIYEDI